MELYDQIFPLRHSWMLVTGLLCGIASVILFSRNRRGWALTLLFFSAFFVRMFVAYLDPFLHDWDERFHALVARNMMHDPFKPMMWTSEWLARDYKIWCCNHIWLHKQPLFLWQMALSMKIFGVSEFSMRYPSVLMGSIGVLLVYGIGKRMTRDPQMGFIAAVLACYSYFHLELISGIFGMDQNDVAFDFYVLCSIWAFAKYLDQKTLKYALLTGVFAGCAILNKWLAGMLVFGAWGIIVLINSRKGNFKKDAAHFALGLLACIVVALPWQLYALWRFPVEQKYELAYNMQHISNAMEGHTGDWMYYMYNFDQYFGQWLCFLLPAGLLLTLFLKKYHNQTTLAIAICFLTGLIFFSFIAQTKIYAYFMIVAPLGHIFIAVCLYTIISHPKVNKFAFIPLTLAAAMITFNLAEITKHHDPDISKDYNYWNWRSRTYNDSLYKDFGKHYPTSIRYVLNVRDAHNFMFYNNDVDACGWIPDKDDIEKLRKKHVSIAVYVEPGAMYLPDRLKGYDSLYIIRVRFR